MTIRAWRSTAAIGPLVDVANLENDAERRDWSPIWRDRLFLA